MTSIVAYSCTTLHTNCTDRRVTHIEQNLWSASKDDTDRGKKFTPSRLSCKCIVQGNKDADRSLNKNNIAWYC